MELDTTLEKYQNLQGRKDEILVNLESKRSELEETEKSLAEHIKSRWVLTEVAKLTQERFKVRVESLVTLAIRSVFDRFFEFKLRFERERNRFVCQPLIKEGGEEYIPKKDMGGSIIDIISFALRIVLWSLETPRSRGLFVVDEPMRWVGEGEELLKGGKFISEISHKLGFQILLITHSPALTEIADKAFKVVRRNKRSQVTVIKEPPKKQLVRRNK